MTNSAATILAHLHEVEAERRKRSTVPGLHDRVVHVKAYQQRRFSHTYADLLNSPRSGAASRFFLDELYGPSDFTRRDAQLALAKALLQFLSGSRLPAVIFAPSGACGRGGYR